MNMKTCGIITEYNPFHEGHIYHIKKTKELTQCNCLIAIVSNHFTQRGLPSLLSMEDKTNLALEAGCNLVIELPACYAAQSADYFAKYACVKYRSNLFWLRNKRHWHAKRVC